MITREKALEILHKNIESQNLRRHCYAVEAVMWALAGHFGENEQKWGLAGLLHDADYELTRDTAQKEHTKKTLGWLRENEVDEDIYNVVARHAWRFVEGAPEPQTKMDWALYCCDELTGLIVAVALVRPDRKLASVTVDSVLKKWEEKSFAAGVNRDQIAMCEEKLGIPLPEFVKISLETMQQINKELGL